MKPLGNLARVTILKQALHHYGAPLQYSTVNEETLLSTSTEGFQSGDLWVLAKRLAVQASGRGRERGSGGGTGGGSGGGNNVNISLLSGGGGSVSGASGSGSVSGASNSGSGSNSILYTTSEDAISMAKTLLSNSTTSSTTSLPVSWSDIGGLHSAKNAITDVFQLPVIFRRLFQLSPVRMPRAVLLYGPPGCGKTLLARAAANECGLAFISVRGKWEREREREIVSLCVRLCV